MTLEALVARAQKGERAALEAVVRELERPIYNLAVRLLGDREHARDATQEVLILVITQLSSFRGESAITTWAYRIATRQLLKQRRRGRRWSFASLEEGLGQPPNAIAPEVRAVAEDRILEEQVFLGCTQAMLLALDPDDRIAFVLGVICELPAATAAVVLEIGEATFRKRLSRARDRLATFLARSCGVANGENRCRCLYQVNRSVADGRFDADRVARAVTAHPTTLEALRAREEIHATRTVLEIYGAQPAFVPNEDFAREIRALLDAASWS